MVLVILFGVVSLLADMTYEGARSVIPQYLSILGADLAIVGFLGGVGELASYLVRFLSGFFSSRYGFLWGLTISGYALTGVSIALLSIASSWLLASLFVVMERIAKGLRTPPRDALISKIAAEGGSGRAFGIHGALDQVGAILGPLVAIYMLSTGGFSGELFLVLSLFSMGSVALLLLARSIYPRDIEAPPRRLSLGVIRGVLNRYVISISIPQVGSVSLFIAIDWVGSSNPILGSLYFIAIQAMQIVFSLALGELYDRIGIRTMYIYYMLAPATVLGIIINPLLLLAIGVILAIEESIQRAVVGDLARGSEALAYGYYHLVYGLSSAIGGYIVGLLIERSLQTVLLILSIACSAMGASIFAISIRDPGSSGSRQGSSISKG